MKSSIPSAPISYKKLNVIAGIVRKQDVNTSLAQLNLMPKKGAKILHKLISSAAANAESNQGQKRENLIVDKIVVNRGVSAKRWLPVSRGRALPYTKHTTSVRVELASVVPAEVAKKAEKAKKTTKKEPVAKKETATKAKVKKTTKSKSTKTATK